jgi:tetratricopeptide (TPR) repeat protein
VFNKMKNTGSSEARRAGDRARDLGQWDAAVAHYEAYLEDVGDDSGIWVQLGNCAKEGGQMKKSIAAYQEALSLQPENADTHLQFGHLFKLMGRLQSAQVHYRTALQLDAGLADAREELAGLQDTIASLPFLLPPTFLDFIPAQTLEVLLEKCKWADPKDDPFRKYADLLS